MKIALVCEFPFIHPQKGVELRLHQTAELLSEIGTVWPVIITRFETPSARLDDLREKFGSVSYIIPTEEPDTSMKSKLLRLIARKKVADRGYHVSADARADLIKQLQACDVVWFHSLKVADSLGTYRWTNGILDFDDLHSKKYLQAAKLDHQLKVKIKGRWLALCWRQWELDALQRFQRVVVCSEEDRKFMGSQEQIEVIQNIFARQGPIENPRDPSGDRVGFIGTLEYAANRDAVRWFVDTVLPLLVKLNPSIQFRIAGKIPAGMAPIDHPNVNLLGFVDNLADEMATWSASVAPLRVGSGTRLKILESFSRRCPVVSTTVGCYGLKVENRVDLLIGDSAEQFALACNELCNSPALGAQLSASACLKWQQNYTLEAVRPVVRRLASITTEPDQ